LEFPNNNININTNNNDAFVSACKNGYIEIATLLASLDNNLKLTIIDNKINIWYIQIDKPKDIKKIDSNLIETCPICLENTCNIITNCNHQICDKCYQLTHTTQLCFMCRQIIHTYYTIL
jgi:hypothetical protein